MNADAVAALREAVERFLALHDSGSLGTEGVWCNGKCSPVTALRAALAAAPLPSEPLDHAPGCDVFRIAESHDPYGEPRHCDCGFALWDAKRRGVYNWTPPDRATPLPSDTPADGLDVQYDEQERWLVETDGDGASRIVARDVSRLHAIAIIAALALTQEPRSGDDR